MAKLVGLLKHVPVCHLLKPAETPRTESLRFNASSYPFVPIKFQWGKGKREVLDAFSHSYGALKLLFTLVGIKKGTLQINLTLLKHALHF